MNIKKKCPTVLFVGRMNVGKSTIFNRLTNRIKSIVYEYEGVTRDYIHEIVEWHNKSFDLIDTGGLKLVKNNDTILQEVRSNVQALFDKTSLILFVVDAKNGLVQEDRLLARMLHKTGKEVILLLNKADNLKKYNEHYPEFLSLGFDNHLAISATHGTGISTLLDTIAEKIPVTTIVDEKPEYKIVIIGKPNAGKSSLMNLLLQEERAIVSPIPGTTREAICEKLHFYQTPVQLTDTAGIRRKSKINEELEGLMVKNAFKSARGSNIAILMIDASLGQIADQELKLMFYLFEDKKSLIIVFNKIDLLDDETKARLEHQMKEYDFFLKKIPILWVSCLTKKKTGAIMTEAKKLWERQQQQFDGTELDDYIQEEFLRKPMYHKTNQIKLYAIKQIQATIPTFALFVNHPSWFGQSQLGFIENILRKKYSLKGCPIDFIVKRRIRG